MNELYLMGLAIFVLPPLVACVGAYLGTVLSMVLSFATKEQIVAWITFALFLTCAITAVII